MAWRTSNGGTIQRTAYQTRPEWPVYAGYVPSPLQVAVLWAHHHTMFHFIRRTDHLMKVYNLRLLLLCVAVLPFTTALLAEHLRGSESERRISALVYDAGALAVTGVFFNAARWHAVRAGLVDPHADPNRLHALGRHWLLVPALYGVRFVLALANPSISLGLYVALLLYYALPGPAVLRWSTARSARAASSGRPPAVRAP